MTIIKCRHCHLKNGRHKISCKKRKKVVLQQMINYYEQMEKEVHKNNSNLNK